jgi:hypothetical protein
MKKVILPLLTYNNKVATTAVSTALSRKLTTFTGSTASQTLALPSTKSKKKEFMIMNNSSVTVAVGCVAANGTITAGTTAGASTTNVATGQVARFVSLGTIWYRIALSPIS